MPQPKRAVPAAHHPDSSPRLSRFLPSLLSSSSGEHYTTSFLFQNTLLAVVISADLLTEQESPIFFTKDAKQDVVTSLSSKPVVFKRTRQSVSEISSTRKRITRSTLFQAPSYNQLLSHYIAVIPVDFTRKRSEPESTQAKLLSQASPDILDFGWWRSDLLSTLTLSSLIPSPSFASAPNPTLLPREELSQSFDDEIGFFFMTHILRSTTPSLISTTPAALRQ